MKEQSKGIEYLGLKSRDSSGVELEYKKNSDKQLAQKKVKKS